jgi:hypothetical protein
MKTNQNTMYFKLNSSLGDHPSLRIWKRLNAFKGSISFDIFQYLKAENEKLQIVYANIRV